MKNIHLLLVFVLLLALSNQSIAQDQETTPRTWYISIVPQFTFSKGFRFDIEKRIPNSVSAIVVSPRIFLGKIPSSSFLNSSFEDFEMEGLGVEVSHKLYLEKELDAARMWYLGYSILYNSVTMSYQNEDWVDFIGLDGNTYSRLEDKDQEVNLNQLGGSVVIGGLFWVDNRIYLDVYIGIGAKRADITDTSSTDEHIEAFDSGIYNYGYQGTYPTGAIKIGIQF